MENDVNLASVEFSDRPKTTDRKSVKDEEERVRYLALTTNISVTQKLKRHGLLLHHQNGSIYLSDVDGEIISFVDDDLTTLQTVIENALSAHFGGGYQISNIQQRLPRATAGALLSRANRLARTVGIQLASETDDKNILIVSEHMLRNVHPYQANSLQAREKILAEVRARTGPQNPDVSSVWLSYIPGRMKLRAEDFAWANRHVTLPKNKVHTLLPEGTMNIADYLRAFEGKLRPYLTPEGRRHSAQVAFYQAQRLKNFLKLDLASLMLGLGK